MHIIVDNYYSHHLFIMQVGVFPIRYLQASHGYFHLQPGEAYAITVLQQGNLCETTVFCSPQYHDQFCSSNDVTLLTCSCSDAAEHLQYLFSTKSSIAEDIDKFKSREAALYRIHRQVWEQLHFEESLQHDTVRIISVTTPLTSLSTSSF